MAAEADSANGRRSRATPDLLKVAGEIYNILQPYTDRQRELILGTVKALHDIEREATEAPDSDTNLNLNIMPFDEVEELSPRPAALAAARAAG